MHDIFATFMVEVSSTIFLTHLVIGVLLGLVVAILPGFGGMVGLTLTIPFIYGMEPIAGIAVMTGLLSMVATADTFPAVLMGIAGSISGQATVVDGYSMAKKGDAARALAAAFTASVVGGLFGAVVLTGALQIAQPLILLFGTGEILLLGVLGITMVGVLTGKSILRATMAAALGLLVGCMGIAPASGTYRFDFGSFYLGSGLPIVIVVLALHAIPKVIELFEHDGVIANSKAVGKGLFQGMRDAFRHRWLVLRSAGIGTTIGILPGVSGSVVDWLAYGHAIQSAKDKSKFGSGDVRGVIAPESANNAKEGGALVPTMLFGVPGSSSSAVFMGGLILLGLEPGPAMVMNSPDMIYLVIWGLAMANILGASLCIGLTRPLAVLTQVPFSALAPTLIFLLILASFQTTGSWGDICVLLALGLLGWVFQRYEVSRPAFIIGFVLSGLIESNLHATISFYGWSEFQRPIFLMLLACCLVSVALGIRRSRARIREGAEVGKLSLDGAVFFLACAGIGVYAIADMAGESFETMLFPTIVAGFLVAMAVAVLLWGRLGLGKEPILPFRPSLKAMAIIGMLVVSIGVFGFTIGALLYAIVFQLARRTKNGALAIGLPFSLAVLSLVLGQQIDMQTPDGFFGFPAGGG